MRLARNAWQPQSVRWDKRAGNSPAAVPDLARRAARGFYLSHPMLVAAVREVQQAARPAAVAREEAGGGAAGMGAAQAAGTTLVAPPALLSSCKHPVRQAPFAEVHAAVMEEVVAGRVERWVEPEGSGLEVFCYRQELGPPRGPISAMCRGLVLHLPSGTVVATPFVRFGERGEAEGEAGPEAAVPRGGDPPAHALAPACSASAGSGSAGDISGRGGPARWCSGRVLAGNGGSSGGRDDEVELTALEEAEELLPGSCRDAANLDLYTGGASATIIRVHFRSGSSGGSGATASPSNAGRSSTSISSCGSQPMGLPASRWMVP